MERWNLGNFTLVIVWEMMKLFAALGVGGLCVIAAVAPRLDSHLLYCRKGHQCYAIAAYLPPPKGATLVEKRPGNALLKSAAALGAIASFSYALVLARAATASASQKQRFRETYDHMELTKAQMLAAEELRQFQNQLTQQAADAAFAALPPQQQAMLMGTTLKEQISPARQLEPVDPSPTEDEEIEQNREQRQNEREREEKALRLLDSAVTTNRSTLLVGATGTGKSVTDAYILAKLLERFPQAEVWVICQKNDSFNGLSSRGRVSLFDPNDPKTSLLPIEKVWEIYEQRRRKKESERNFKDQPVRLKLADWHSIYEACRDEKWFTPYVKKLGTLITVGRELNLALLIDTQSFNLDALGLAKDANIRQNLNILAQGYSGTDECGNLQGDYGVLINLLNNRFVFPSPSTRERLRAELNPLKDQSQRQNQPLLLSALEPPTLAIVPNLRHYKTPATRLEGYSPEDWERIYRLEFDLDGADNSPDSPRSHQGCQPDTTHPTQSPGQPEPLSPNLSAFSWSVRKVRHFYPDTDPEQLFLSVSAAARAEGDARTIIRKILKCGEGNDHPTRSYTRHGKTLLLWLIDNYDKGDLAKLPKIQKFLSENQ